MTELRLPTVRRAIAEIEKAGMLLVFPIKERPGLPSLWSAFYPGEEMDWDWSDEGDDRVPTLWHLRTELSTSREVVYSKWIRDRATCFSLELFTALLSLVSTRPLSTLKLSPEAAGIIAALEEDSPLPTKELKSRSELEGRENSARFERGMKELWRKFLIVGYGEVEEGGYPSLAVGASRLLFEEEWDVSKGMQDDERRDVIRRYCAPDSELYGMYSKIERSVIGGGRERS